MANIHNIKVGDKVGVKTVGNAARYTGSEYYEGTVIKVGRKYFYVSIEGINYMSGINIEKGIPFELEDLFQGTDYSIDFEFYFSLQEAMDSDKVRVLANKLSRELSYGDKRNYNLKQLEQVAEILGMDV